MAWWIKLIVIAGALLMGAGGVIALVNPAMLVAPGADINAATHVYAGYLVSRNLVLAVMLLVMLGLRAKGPLRTMMVTVALVQFADAVLDAVEGRLPLIPGVLV